MLGVGVIAAVGAGGMATVQDKPAVSISLPDSSADKLPDAKSIPGVGSLMSDDSDTGYGNENTAPLSALTTAVHSGDGR